MGASNKRKKGSNQNIEAQGSGNPTDCLAGKGSFTCDHPCCGQSLDARLGLFGHKRLTSLKMRQSHKPFRLSHKPLRLPLKLRGCRATFLIELEGQASRSSQLCLQNPHNILVLVALVCGTEIIKKIRIEPAQPNDSAVQPNDSAAKHALERLDLPLKTSYFLRSAARAPRPAATIRQPCRTMPATCHALGLVAR